MDITITIPDGVASRVKDGFAGMYNYQETIDGQPNPENKALFTKRLLLEHVKNVVVAWEAKQASETARVAAIEAAENEIELS